MVSEAVEIFPASHKNCVNVCFSYLIHLMIFFYIQRGDLLSNVNINSNLKINYTLSCFVDLSLYLVDDVTHARVFRLGLEVSAYIIVTFFL